MRGIDNIMIRQPGALHRDGVMGRAVFLTQTQGRLVRSIADHRTAAHAQARIKGRFGPVQKCERVGGDVVGIPDGAYQNRIGFKEIVAHGRILVRAIAHRKMPPFLTGDRRTL